MFLYFHITSSSLPMNSWQLTLIQNTSFVLEMKYNVSTTMRDRTTLLWVWVVMCVWNSLWRLLVTGRDDFYQNSPKCCFILVILIMIKFPDENFITKFYLYYTCFRVECYFDILLFDTMKLCNIAICESSVFLLP